MPPPRIRVTVIAPDNVESDYWFEKAFRIGRTDDCEVCIKNEFVSRVHAEVLPRDEGWWLHDKNSSNGIFANGERVESLPIGNKVSIRLGVEGPQLLFGVVEAKPLRPGQVGGDKEVVDQYISHYFNKDDSVAAGEHTMYMRKAFAQVQTKQRRTYGWIFAVLGLCVAAISAFAIYQHREMAKQKSVAEDLFYAMKSLDVDIANLERVTARSSDQAAQQEVKRFQARRVDTQKSYDQCLAALHVYDPKMTPERKLILRVARIFGECELTMPNEFADEIDKYIKQWQSTKRLKKAITLANENHYTSYISQQMLAQDLPPQFFYLALQESDFDARVSGPVTVKGIAKGMWQFIPETALKYGLHIGPLVDLRRPDPGDDRHHFDRETKAAASYLKDLYSTDAQASGLLVMASYNWGEGRVLPLIRSMPDNPKERNFWQLLSRYKDKMPQETYDYVFSIASAAVIGEDPKLFGFDFENPLMEERTN